MDNLDEMDKFLETYSLPRLSQEETDNLRRLIIRSEIKSVKKQNNNNNNNKKKTPCKQSPRLGGFTGKFYQTYKEELISIFLKLFQNIKEKETSQIHSMRTPLP